MKTKRFIACLCIISMILSMVISVQAAETKIEVGSATFVCADGTETVEIPLTLSGNTGIVGMQLNVEYTDGLTLINAPEQGEALQSLNFEVGGTLSENPYGLMWEGKKADSTNGVLTVLKFSVPKNTAKDYSINLTGIKALDDAMGSVNISVVNGKISITKRDFTGLSLADKAYTYDGMEKSLSVSGVPSDATVTYTSEDFDTDGKAIDAGTYNITATVSKDGYNNWTATKTLTINKKTVAVKGLSAISREYDGTNVVELSEATLDGLVARDAQDQYCNEHQCFRIKCAIPFEGEFADANVGNNKAVTVREIALDGCSAGNYTLNQPTGLKANITKKTIKVKAEDITIKVGEEIDGLEYTVTGLIDGDKLSGELAVNCSDTSVANDYSITQGTLGNSNYNIEFTPGTLHIVDKTPQNIKFSEVQSEAIYGDDGFTINVLEDANEDFGAVSFETSDANVATVDGNGNVVVKNAGTTTITASREAGNNDYAPFSKTWTLTVNKAKITITATGGFKKIGQEDPELEYEVNGSLVGEDEIKGKLERAEGEAIGKYDINVGSLAIYDSLGNISRNYDITFNKDIFEILDKDKQVIAISKADIPETITYGDEGFNITTTTNAMDENPTIAYASDNEEVITINNDGDVKIVGVGKATITATASETASFSASTDKVEITVAKKAIEIGYDGDDDTFVLTGIVGEDKVEVDTWKEEIIEKISTETAVTSTIKMTGFTIKGEDAGNYTVAKPELDLTKEVTTALESVQAGNNSDVSLGATAVGESNVVVENVVVAGEADMTNETITIDATAVTGAGTNKVETVTISTGAVNAIVTATEATTEGSTASLEVVLKKDGDTVTSVTLDAKALVAVKTNASEVSATDIKISVEAAAEHELAAEQQVVVEAIDDANKPVVYTLKITDQDGNGIINDQKTFGDGIAKVRLPWEKPAGNNKVVAKWLKDDGTLGGALNAVYDAVKKYVELPLNHFSDYLIYAEPIVYTSSGGGGGVSSYTVKFDTDGGSAVKSQNVSKNKTVTEPTVPNKDGYTFDGWYTDKDLTEKYDFESKVTKSFTLYAKWVENKAEEQPEETDKPEMPDTQAMPFTDVDANDWYYETVKTAFEKGLMNGISDTEFGADTNVTRGMFVTVLYRMENEPVAPKLNFTDVESGVYYTEAIAWANANNIAKGITDTKFAPNDNITREQMATILFRYATYKGMDTMTLEENLEQFTDNSEISEYAISALNWAVGNNVMSGKGNGILDPKGLATRAEAAAVLVRMAK